MFLSEALSMNLISTFNTRFMAAQTIDVSHDISSQYGTPPAEPFTSFNALKDRIKHHYEVCSEYYYSLW